MQSSVEGFIRDMTVLDIEATLEADLVLCNVVAVDGAHAGKAVAVGVAVAELGQWPQVPPHWLHFPSSVRFSRTNYSQSPKAGWLMHSRQIAGWGDAPAGVAGRAIFARCSVRRSRDASHVRCHDPINGGRARSEPCSRRRTRRRLHGDIPVFHGPDPCQRPDTFGYPTRPGIDWSTGMQP